VRLIDLDLDLVLQYPSKPALLPSLRRTCPERAVDHEVEDLMFRNIVRGQTGDRMAPSIILN
jgi:hypothetical protein